MIDITTVLNDAGTIARMDALINVRIPMAMRDGHINVTNFLEGKVREYLVPVVTGESRRSVYVQFGPSTTFSLTSNVRSALP
jgi:hypothetical protein